MSASSAISNVTIGHSELEERTVAGLHDFLLSTVIERLNCNRGRAVDLGAGSGALALRLRSLGWDVRGADVEVHRFKADVPFVHLDLNEPDFADQLGERTYDLVTSVEVLEHVESPISFLRNVGRLLSPEGVAVITTPNVDNIPARLKFFLRGKIRMMDELGDPTHISPIYWDLLVRRYLPLAGLKLVGHFLYPPHGYAVTRTSYSWMLRPLALFLSGESLYGDNHLLVLRSQ